MKSDGSTGSRSPRAFELIQFQPEVERQRDQQRATLLEVSQRIEADGVGREKFVQLDDKPGPLGRTRLEECRDVFLGEIARQMQDQPLLVVAGVYPALHARVGGKNWSV